MRKVKDILFDFSLALEDNDYMEMIELVKEMEDVDPSFVSLMINSVYDEDDEDFFEEEYEEED